MARLVHRAVGRFMLCSAALFPCSTREHTSACCPLSSKEHQICYLQKIKSDDLWKAVKSSDGGDAKWYKVAVDYWDKQEASYDGVLGGYGFVSDIDLRDSEALLLKVQKRFPLNSCTSKTCAVLQRCVLVNCFC